MNVLRRGVQLADGRRRKGPRTVKVGGERFPTTEIDDLHLAMDVADEERVSIAIESMSTEPLEGSALVEIRALSQNGTRLAIPGWKVVSNRVAEYSYLEVTEPGELALTRIDLKVPRGAIRLELLGRRWKSAVGTSIVGDPIVNRSTSANWSFTTPTGAALDYLASSIDQMLPIPVGSDKVEISVDHVGRGVDSNGPLSITVYDGEGSELLPLSTLQQHPLHGPIVLLKGRSDERQTTLVRFQVPRSAACVRVRGIDWGEKTAHLSGAPQIKGVTDSEQSIEEFIAAIPATEQLLVIDTTAPPMGHATLGLRPNNLSAAYERAGRWVVFLPFSSLQDFPHAHSERIYQVPRTEIDRLWSALREHRRGTSDVYLCSSFPSLQALTAANDLKRLGWTVVYEVRDDMEEFNRVGYSKWYAPILEQRMLETADRVVSVSRTLDEKMVSMQPNIGVHTVVPNGVRLEVIEENRDMRTPEAAERRIASRTVGYVGHLTESWFDWPMLRQVADAMPEVTFEIVGHGKPKKLELPANVVYLGPKTHDELRDIVVGWKAGLIPFRDIPLTRSVDPNKIYEYFAWGLRCVTVEMGAVSEYPWTRVYGDVPTFIDAIRWALQAPVEESDLAELAQFITTVDWDSRAHQMLSFIESGAVR